MIYSEKPKARKRAFTESELQKMSENKIMSKKHWRHKPYECDFGGGKSDTDK